MSPVTPTAATALWQGDGVSPPPKEPVEKDPAPAVSRAVRILDVLAAANGVAQPLSDLARSIGAAKSSTSNLCAVLEAAGLIRRGDAGYTLGHRVVELGGAYLGGVSELEEFYRFCRDAPVLSHEVVQLAMLDGTHVVYLARHESLAPLRLIANVGDRFPAAPTALGNALLTRLDDDEIARRFDGPDAFPHRTAKSVRDLPGLLRKVHRARDAGFALDEEEVHPGITGIAMPIPPRSASSPALAVGVSLLTDSATPERRDAVILELRRLVVLLTNQLVPAGMR